VPISILDRIQAGDIGRDPFPHVVIENALPDSYFEKLAREFPGLEAIAGSGELENNTAYIKSASEIAAIGASAEWRAFFEHHCSPAFYRQAIALWGDDIRRFYPSLERRLRKPLDQFTVGQRTTQKSSDPAAKAHDVKMDCQFVVNSPVRSPRSVRGPHIDSQFKLFAALLYFRVPGDSSTGGELQFYDGDAAVRQAAAARLIQTIPYRANTLVMWVNSTRSIHGVSPRSVTDVPRRYVNFLAETYAYDDAGLFGSPEGPLKRLSRRLLG
jgi:hypothetical protein